MARIGILAFGSLIGDPGDEISQLEVVADRRRGVSTPFAVEFARSSTKRGGAPTLVPHSAGARVTAEIIVLETTEQLAKDALWRRETDNIGSQDGYRERRIPGPNTLVIQSFQNLASLPLVIAATFAATIDHPTATGLAELAIASAKDRNLRPGRDGITYLIKAKACGILTPLSPQYEAEILRLSRATSLEEARTKFA